jgi:alkanesulfonate monooxygenase SsuD/methylene tetrahydromethanopterin reductase-like flavin-dependent oxidoreductase (luciferase family)
MPLEHPVRLAEDAAVVDLLSGGRLELGLGSGIDPADFAAFGYDPEQRRRLMREGLDTLLSSLEGRPLPSGQVVHPVSPGLRHRVWQGVFSPERTREAAAQGTHVLLPKASPNIPGLAAEDQARAAQAFFEAWSHPWPGQVALSRPVYPSLDVESARRELAEEIRFLVDLANVRSGDGARLTVQDYLDSGVFHMGSVDDVVASLTADPALGCATELICQVGHIGPGLENTVRALELLATEVGPALGWRPQRGLTATGAGDSPRRPT